MSNVFADPVRGGKGRITHGSENFLPEDDSDADVQADAEANTKPGDWDSADAD